MKEKKRQENAERKASEVDADPASDAVAEENVDVDEEAISRKLF